MVTSVVMLSFPSRSVLTKALDRMVGLDYVDIKRGAIVARAASGEIQVLDDEVTPNQAGIAGGTLGAALGVFGAVSYGAIALTGVGLIFLGTTALIGGLIGNATGRFAASRLDFGFRSDLLHRLAEQLKEGRAALVLELKGDTHLILGWLARDLGPYKFEVMGAPELQAAGV